MKILELRFKNLNSLYGEWVIEFTDSEYVSNGIFALTGPTGAGKSTILDAICLALYGATPRLGKITKSGNEIMSRQTGECYAEVLFESQTGRFRCHWEQRRARKRADGNLQNQEHQITDADTGKLIETKKSLVGGVIEEKTGMDFDRFTRSILLAQGGFDTFLKADVEQKSKILEQITGTEIYSEISRRVHERQRDEREKLNLLRAEISGILILEPEQENEIQNDLKGKQKQETKLADHINKTEKAIRWLNTIEDLRGEIHNLTKEKTKLLIEVENFKPKRGKLEQALNAASLDGTYATLDTLRKQQSDDQAALDDKVAALPKLESSAKKQAKSLKAAEQRTLESKANLKAAAPLIQKIRFLDQKIEEQAKAITETSDSCIKETAKIETDKQTRIEEQEKLAKAEVVLETSEVYLKENAQDEWLIGGLAGVEEQMKNLLNSQEEITQKETDLEYADAIKLEALSELDAITKQCIVRKKELENAKKNLQRSKDVLKEILGNKSLREYRAKKESLQKKKEYLTRIAALEDHRAKLEDGKPCPLCGSIEHPFAEGNVPVSDEIEQKFGSLTKLISNAEDQETAIKKLEKTETAARKKLNDSEKLKINVANKKKLAEKTLAELKNGLIKLQTRFKEIKLSVSQKLQPLGITEIPESEISLLIDSLNSRLKTWQEQFRKKSTFGNQIASIDSEIRRLNAVIDTQHKALTEKQENLNQLRMKHANDKNERKHLYGDKEPDDEEANLNNAITNAEQAEKEARSLDIEMHQNLTTAKNHIETLKRQIEQRESELNEEKRVFSSALARIGFADERQFLTAILTIEERESLSSQAKKLDDAQTELNAKINDRETRLATESVKKVTDKTLEELLPRFNEHEDSLKELRDTIAGLKHKLSENATAKARVKEKQSAILAQKIECHRWEKLHGLIGSADGKKYRTFAQGLTFELMVSHANRQLQKMTDRYLLIRDEQQPLELNVVDSYQAGEIRSTKNLSGGESFIVSLTLALGLSKMASQKVRVDSLFLDEGFGTLDEEALDTALDTLSGLQQDGKLIGIISHVSALKERISTQISINPVSGGRSSLSGPGCTMVAKN